jgi:predicted TIM-barrel fold metal-dependent hydrolase
MAAIDTHAHAFTLDADLAGTRRYTPEHSAPLTDYLSQLDGAGVAQGVLVQPSFLGTDNSYLLQSLAAWPDRLRGIVVIDPSCDEATMAAMSAAHVVGLRLNLLGLDHGFVADADWQRLFARAKDLGWQIEIHTTGNNIPFLLSALWPSGANIVIDHFGRPDPAAGLADPGIKAMLARADSERIWIKLSGPYRCAGQPNLYARTFLDAFGAQRLMWGSDWPWTQHSEGMTFARALGWLSEWLPEEACRQTVLRDTPRALFGFDDLRAGSSPGATQGVGSGSASDHG